MQDESNDEPPGGETRLTTYAVSTTGAAADVQVARLSRWFSAQDILAALQADQLVRVGLGGTKPSDLDSLVSELTRGGRTDSRHCYSWPGDMLDRFVLHHVEGNRVAVRIGLPGSGACRNELTELGILLPSPVQLAEALRRATDGKEGVLPATIARVPELAKGDLELTFKGPL